MSGTDLETMPLNVLPKIFQSYPKVVTQLKDSEKLDLFNGPIPGNNVIISFFFFYYY